MNHWINYEFFKNCWVLLSAQRVLPALKCTSICEVTNDFLLDRNVEGCIIDINQTLVAYDTSEINPEIVRAVNRLKKNFRICALSNYVSSAQDSRALARKDLIERVLGIPVICSKSRKPSPLAFDEALRYLECSPSNCAFIGDRIFTDIAGANLAGLLAVLVDPLRKEADPIFVSIPRRIERTLFSMLHGLCVKEA